MCRLYYELDFRQELEDTNHYNIFSIGLYVTNKYIGYSRLIGNEN